MAMSHVDEGALHAYLDGALDALPASEAARIRQHLASCEECERRLEEERALRDEAASILRGADPGTGAVPPLEELRRRAAARARSGAGPRLRQLTWAASLVLAVGAGWFLRGTRDPRISEALDPLLREAAEERAVPAEVAEEPAAGAGAPGRAEAPAPAPAGGGGAVEVQAVQEHAADVVAGAEAARAEVAGVAGADPVAPRAARVAAPSMAVSGEARGGELTRALVRPQADQAKVAAAEADAARWARGDAGAIAVPGLPVLSVEDAREDLPAGTLRVLQLLEADTLELLHLPAGVDPSAVAGPGDRTRTQVAVRYGAGWLLGRAHASAEVLETLLARVTGGG
jgi:hypothetical protein